MDGFGSWTCSCIRKSSVMRRGKVLAQKGGHDTYTGRSARRKRLEIDFLHFTFCKASVDGLYIRPGQMYISLGNLQFSLHYLEWSVLWCEVLTSFRQVLERVMNGSDPCDEEQVSL